MREDKIYELLGDRLTANEMSELIRVINGYGIKPVFTEELRIKIQDYAQKVGTTYSGASFTNYLNTVISPGIALQEYKRN